MLKNEFVVLRVSVKAFSTKPEVIGSAILAEPLASARKYPAAPPAPWLSQKQSVTVEAVERKQWKPHALVRNLSNRTSIVPVNTSEDAASPVGLTAQMASPEVIEGF